VKLELAKNLLRDSKAVRTAGLREEAHRPEERARERLRQIVKKWPDTKAAVEAQQILDQ
jgi:hypothetical protein